MAESALPPDGPLPAEPDHHPQRHRRGALLPRTGHKDLATTPPGGDGHPRVRTALPLRGARPGPQAKQYLAQSQSHLETIRLRLEHPERLEELLLGISPTSAEKGFCCTAP